MKLRRTKNGAHFLGHPVEHLAHLQLVLPLSGIIARVLLFWHLTAHECLRAYCLDLAYIFCSGVASMEQMEQLLPPERQGPLM